jgi:hypothetical protein
MQQEDGRLRESAADHRRRTRRAERHLTSQAIHTLEGDDLDAAVPVKSVHDVGHKTSSSPPKARKPGRRDGFKVWKTSFWKRRKEVRRVKARAERLIVEEE